MNPTSISSESLQSELNFYNENLLHEIPDYNIKQRHHSLSNHENDDVEKRNQKNDQKLKSSKSNIRENYTTSQEEISSSDGSDIKEEDDHSVSEEKEYDLDEDGTTVNEINGTNEPPKENVNVMDEEDDVVYVHKGILAGVVGLCGLVTIIPIHFFLH